MTRTPPDPHSPADTERTTALPRRRPPAGDDQDPREVDPRVSPAAGPAYQETTVLRRPPRDPVPSNVPGADRDRPRGGSSLPPYAGPDIPARLAGVGAAEPPPELPGSGGEGHRDPAHPDAASYPYGPPSGDPQAPGGAHPAPWADPHDAAPGMATAGTTEPRAGLRRQPR